MRGLGDRARKYQGMALVLAAFVLGAIPGTSRAAPTYTVTGSVSKKCTLSATTISVSIRKQGSNTTYTVNGVSGSASATVTARCNASTGGTLGVSAPVLVNNNQAFTVAVSGWGTTFNYTAGNTAATRSAATTSATVTFTVSASTGSWSNGTYTSTITITNTAN